MNDRIFTLQHAKLALAATLAVAVSCGTSSTASASLSNDTLVVYKARVDTKASPAGTKFPSGVTRTINAIDSQTCSIVKEKTLDVPAATNGGDILDETRHFVGYQAKCPAGVDATATFFDRFFPAGVQIEFDKLQSVLVPSGKSTDLLATPPAPPAGTNRYFCYKAKAPKMDPITVSIGDQFATRQFTLSKVAHVCVPGDFGGDDPSALTDPYHYVCYKAKPAAKGSFPTVRTNNLDFGANSIATGSDTEICTAAFKNVIPSCGNLHLEAGEECETNTDCSGGDVCSTGCTCLDPSCPGTVEWTRHAAVGTLVTDTDRDVGWVGFGHDTDIADGSTISLRVDDASGTGPSSCGTMSIVGLDPAAGNCRCANDNHARCDRPFEADYDDCGGELCMCFSSPPESISAGGLSYCLVRSFTSDPTGTWNVDSGAASVSVHENEKYYLGPTLLKPCPNCSGDTTRNDGVRGGTCMGGADNGQACDANSEDASYPVASGGGEFSFDCLPTAGVNVSGPGVNTDAVFVTGSSSLPSGLDCGVGEHCPCGACDHIPQTTACGSNSDCASETHICSGSRDFSCTSNADCQNADAGSCNVGIARCSGAIEHPCATNADCSNVNLGTCNAQTCTTNGDDSDARPNSCTGGVCSNVGGDEGECSTGPDDRYCDAFVRANGEGIFACASNSDCEFFVAGACTLTQRRRCFLDPVAAAGTASTSSPLLVAATCHAPSGNTTINLLYGFPGPARTTIDGDTVFRCAGSPGSTYPGCP